MVVGATRQQATVVGETSGPARVGREFKPGDSPTRLQIEQPNLAGFGHKPPAVWGQASGRQAVDRQRDGGELLLGGHIEKVQDLDNRITKCLPNRKTPATGTESAFTANFIECLN
jgi:hypothetical protein